MSQRNIYLEKTDLETARRVVLENFIFRNKTEEIDSGKSWGFRLAEPVYARISSPLFHVSAMDGVAVNSKITAGASRTNPVQLKIDKDVFYINTGEPIPKNTDSVIIIEKINFIDDSTIEIEESSFPFANIRKTGEDIVATEMIFPSLHKIAPQDIGALLSGGVTRVKIFRKPVIAVIPTGNELIAPDTHVEKIKPGSVIESNSSMLASFIEKEGGKALRCPSVKDDPETLAAKLKKYANDDKIDMILTIGGSSAGSRDYTKKAIEKKGDVLIHGITIMPGKPAIAGRINEKPVFGIPGYPVSAAIIFDMLIKPLLKNFLNEKEDKKDEISLYPVRGIPSKLGTEEFVRVKIGKVNERFIAAPLPRGAGTITSITEADGIIRIPSNLEGLTDSEPVKAELLRDRSLIENTLLMVGSHDNTIDIISGMMAEKGERISSTHVGSMGGIMAVKKNGAHLAGIHLLDTETGEYNISYLKKYSPDRRLKIIHLVSRYQGLIVAKGNPLEIKNLNDLAERDLRFINRQKGSGTRILTDFECKKNNIDTSRISGFNIEEFTHMNIAVAVKSNAADAGMGIKAAARAMDLDFIPVTKEDYQLIIPEEFFNLKSTQVLIEIINSKDFKEEVLKAGGYEVNRTGEIIDFP